MLKITYSESAQKDDSNECIFDYYFNYNEPKIKKKSFEILRCVLSISAHIFCVRTSITPQWLSLCAAFGFHLNKIKHKPSLRDEKYHLMDSN